MALEILDQLSTNLEINVELTQVGKQIQTIFRRKPAEKRSH